MTTTDRRNGLLGAIAMKAPCKLATTAAITLSGHQSIDGTTTVEDDRVLVKDQGTTTENGIYVASSGNWSRATDFDSGADVENGSMVLVTNGSANANIIYRLNASGDVTIDTTALTFSAVLDTVSVDATLATWLATPTSANLAAAVTNETGSGLLVFGTGPTLTGATVSGTLAVTGAGVLTVDTTAAGAVHTITSTEAGATAGPGVVLYRNSATPAASDSIGYIQFSGEDSAGNEQSYGSLVYSISDPTSTSEDSTATQQVLSAGSAVSSIIATGSNGGAVAVKGTNTNDNASAGYVGEYISSTVVLGSAVSLTNDTTANVTSISLTAGDWDVSGVVAFNPNAATTMTANRAAISTTSATVPTAGNAGYTWGANPGTGLPIAISTGVARLSLNATTTVYLVARSTFAVNTQSAYGTISARRVR
jgi:hypothetical protein